MRNEDKYRNLIETINEVIYEVDTHGIIRYIAPSVENLIGIPPALITGRLMTDFIGGDEDFLRQRIRVLEEQKEIISEYRVATKSGSFKWIRLSTQAVYHDGIFTGGIGMLIDITSWKEALQALETSEENYRLLAENIADVIWIINVNYDAFTYMSPSIVRLSGYNVEESIRMSLEEILEPASAILARQQMTKMVNAFLADPGHPEVFYHEFQQNARDGRLIWIETTSYCRFNPAGEVEILGVSRNIEQRKQVELFQAEQEALYRSILQASPDVIVVTDLTEGRIRVISPKAIDLFNLPENIDCRQYTLFDFLDESDHAKAIGFMAKMIEGPQGAVDYKARKSDGTLFDVEVNSDLIRDKNGIPTSQVIIIRDITDRKIAENALRERKEALKEMNAAKDKLFSIIAHDLRSPFSGFLGLTKMMEETFTEMNREQQLTFIRGLGASARNIFRLLENLLEWSQLQQGLLRSEPESFFPESRVQNLLALIRDMAANKQITLEVNVPGTLSMFGDTRMFDVIIRNLVTNAVKFTPRGGTISIQAYASGPEEVEIAVRDNGIGMSPGIIDNLFKLDSTSYRKGTNGEDSSGLGLILCKEFVEKNGGRIRVESEPGKGSVFNFTFPGNSVCASPEVSPGPERVPHEEGQHKPLKVLIVEDDFGSSLMFKTAFSKEGYEILLAGNGEKAVSLCRQHPDIDLILMDIEMPVMDGLEATRRIREFNRNVVIIIQSALQFTGGSALREMSGCNEFMQKPISTEALNQLIAKHFINR